MSEFQPAFENTMNHEDATRSGKVTTDAGGKTRFGIAEKFNPDLPEEFFTGPKDKALSIAEMRMQEDYWTKGNLAQIENQDVANKVFDMMVDMGVHQGAIYAQRAANFLIRQSIALPSPDGATGELKPLIPEFTLAEDGVLGPKSIAAINSFDQEQFIQILRELSAAHYKHIAAVNPSQQVNLDGWLKRAAT